MEQLPEFLDTTDKIVKRLSELYLSGKTKIRTFHLPKDLVESGLPFEQPPPSELRNLDGFCSLFHNVTSDQLLHYSSDPFGTRKLVYTMHVIDCSTEGVIVVPTIKGVVSRQQKRGKGYKTGPTPRKFSQKSNTRDNDEDILASSLTSDDDDGISIMSEILNDSTVLVESNSASPAVKPDVSEEDKIKLVSQYTGKWVLVKTNGKPVLELLGPSVTEMGDIEDCREYKHSHHKSAGSALRLQVVKQFQIEEINPSEVLRVLEPQPPEPTKVGKEVSVFPNLPSHLTRAHFIN